MITNYIIDYFNKNKIKQKEIVLKTGISQSKVSLILNGKRKLTADELGLIIIAFDINLEQIKRILR